MKCSFMGCDEKAVTRKLCERHLIRLSRIEGVSRKERHVEQCHPYAFPAIYLIGAPEMEYVKVGRAKDAPRRLRDLQVSMPFDLTIMGLRFGSPAAVEGIEWAAHETLKDLGFHRRGEWFTAEPGEILELLDRLAEQAGVRLYSPKQMQVLRRDSMEGASIYFGRGVSDDEIKDLIAAEVG